MKLIIGNKKKAQVFTAIFQNLNKFTNDINIIFKDEELYIQGMDSSHCSMFEIVLKADWFENYECNEQHTLGVNASILYKIFSTKQDNQIIIMSYNNDDDKLNICFKNLEKTENEFTKEFCIPLMDIESELLQVPEVDPEIFINISTKSISTMISQLEIFGDIVELDYSKNELSFNGSGDNGDIRILLKDDKHENFNNCEINLNGDLKLSYSVKYIQNFCSFSKINKNVNVIFNQQMPMIMHYELEDSNNSYVKFYLAPKIED